MRRFLFGSRRRKAIVAVVVALTLAGSAIAAWVITVNGQTGRGRIATLQNPIVSSPASNPSASCFPGSTCDFTVDIQNPNSYALILTAVNFNSGTPIVSTTPGGSQDSQCGAGNVTLNNLSGLNISVPAGTSTATLTGAWTLSSSAPVQCQGDYVQNGGSNTYTFSTP